MIPTLELASLIRSRVLHPVLYFVPVGWSVRWLLHAPLRSPTVQTDNGIDPVRARFISRVWGSRSTIWDLAHSCPGDGFLLLDVPERHAPLTRSSAPPDAFWDVC